MRLLENFLWYGVVSVDIWLCKKFYEFLQFFSFLSDILDFR